MTITERVEAQPRSKQILLGIVLFVVVGLGDYLTHTNYDLEVSPFYLAPVSYFSWFLGRGVGLAVALASVSIGFTVRLLGIPRPVALWDALVRLTLYVGVTLMTVQLRRLYEQERYLSRIDSLTRIPNRRAFLESAHRAKSFSDRYNIPLSIAYLDLDGFKQMNDRLGHGIGDKILTEAASVIQKSLRPTDVVARIGGDEFAVLLPATAREDAIRVLERVRLEFGKSMQEWRWPITFSVGLVSFTPPLASVAEMIRMADEAMYAAKTQGKDRLEQRESIA